MLDLILAQGHGLCLGAVSLHPLLWLRKHLAANYWIHLRGHREDNPTKGVLQMGWEQERTPKGSFGGKGRK